MSDNHPVAGLYEHWYGTSDLEAAIRYWGQLGFEVSNRGQLDAPLAESLYGHRSPVESVRLRHVGVSEHGLIRLQRWQVPRGPGLGFAHSLSLGSRWSGFYTRDILQIRDAYCDDVADTGATWHMSELARLFITEAKPTFFQPFVGIRETTVFGPEHRHAFLQRVGFDRPGFGTFSPKTPLSTTEATHGNLVTRSLDDQRFYTEGLGLNVQTPVVRLDWTNPTVRRSLSLRDGEAFRVIVFMSPGRPSGFLRLYASEQETHDVRERSQPGELGLTCFSYRYAAGALPARVKAVQAAGGTVLGPIALNEFGEPSVSCLDSGGCYWNLVEARSE